MVRTYTVQQGWTIQSGGVYWIPANGGNPGSDVCTPQHGWWGQLDNNGVIVEKRIPLPKGTYSMWGLYTMVNPSTGQIVKVASPTVSVQIN